MKNVITSGLTILITITAFAQPKAKNFPLSTTDDLKPVNVKVTATVYEGKKGLQVLDTAQGITGELKYAKLTVLPFHNGSIEVELSGKPAVGAVESARGFVGIAFRIADADTAFECIYLRPANGRAVDQVRRNHSVQYVSYPHYPWEKLRKESPEKYESYVDLETGKWTKVKIVVKDSTAWLYVHGSSQPTLIISDLKLGADSKGSIGLWVGPGTEAHFRNLVVTPDN
jgi:hypothetical protein